MLRIHFMQQWFNLSDPAMEEALYDSFSMRQFAKLPGGRAPDETTILNFRHLLEKHNIAEEMFKGVNLLLQDYGLMVRRRSEEHTSELQSLMRISYAVFCLKKKK